jgi:hypothetical protein
MAMTRISLLAALILTTLSASQADAQEAAEASVDAPRQTFDENLAVGVYGTGWLGAYAGAGVGGRIRWEPFDLLGIDLFGEALLVENPGGGFRHDYPIGFNIYIPIDLADNVRLRPLFGFCAVFSLIEPAEEGAPRADDVLFGIHGGAGVEWSPFRHFSFFLDVQATGYLGHDRSSQGWTGEVSEDYATFGLVQASLGTQIHFSL